MQHTRGPWTVADDGTIEAKFFGRVGQLVGCCDADARLIAAAPALLAALEACVCAMQDYQAGIGITEMFDKGERMGRAAIAKAKGEV